MTRPEMAGRQGSLTRRLLFCIFLTAGVAAHAEYSSYFYWQVDDSVADFSYAQLKLSGGSQYFTIGDTTYTKVGAETTGDATLGQTTLAVAANLGAYASSDYSFLVEVFGEDDGLLAWSDAFSYDDIAGAYVYSDMSSALSGSAYGVSISNVPEPTGGILLLMGLSLLGLRRKRYGGDGARRHAMTALVILLAPVYLFAAANDVVLTFSTPGPDTYADGKLLSADDRLVLVAGVAEGGRCPTTVFEMEAVDYAAYEGGSFSLYLLDTRVKDAEGNVSAAGANTLALNAPETVNAIGLASSESSSSMSGSSLSLAPASAVALGTVGVLSKIDAPTITAIKIDGDVVSITVKDTSSAADYFVVPGAAPGSFATALDAKRENDTFTFPRPKAATFFKVIGVRKFQ